FLSGTKQFVGVENEKGPRRRALGSWNFAMISRCAAPLCKTGKLDAAGELDRTVQQIERREIIHAADIIAPAVVRPKQDPGIAASRRLAHLDVKPIGMQRDFARDGDAGLIRAQIVVTVAKTERGGERQQLAPRVRVEKALGLGAVGNRLAEIKSGRSARHGRILWEREEGRGQTRLALSFPAGFTPLPRAALT